MEGNGSLSGVLGGWRVGRCTTSSVVDPSDKGRSVEGTSNDTQPGGSVMEPVESLLDCCMMKMVLQDHRAIEVDITK